MDEGDWPLVLLNWESPIGLMDQALFQERFVSWLGRRTPFALLSVQPDPDCRHLFAGPWISGYASAVAACCVAIACVVPDEMRCLDASSDEAALAAAMPCPCRLFADTGDALRWLRRLLGQARDPDLAAATRTQRYIDMRGRGTQTQ